MNAKFALLALALSPLATFAQDKPAEDKPAATETARKSSSEPWDRSITDCRKQSNRAKAVDCEYALSQNYYFPLHNAAQQNDANEVLIAVRNITDPGTKIYLVASQNLIVVRTFPEEAARIDALVKSLDIPRKTYRVTYTIVESDAGKRLGVQHFSYVVTDGQRGTMKEGSKVPIATGKYDEGKNGSQTQFTYLDVGMNFDCTLTGTGTGASIKAKVEQSSIAESKTISDVVEPVVRQSVIEAVFNIPFGKPATIGAIDVPGSTRHLDIELQADPL